MIANYLVKNIGEKIWSECIEIRVVDNKNEIEILSIIENHLKRKVSISKGFQDGLPLLKIEA